MINVLYYYALGFFNQLKTKIVIYTYSLNSVQKSFLAKTTVQTRRTSVSTLKKV